MARDPGLEELLAEQLDGAAGISSKALFGGWCWLLRGHLLCGARHDGLLLRLGREQAASALRHPGVEPMTVGPRMMPGWVRVRSEAFADDALRQRLIGAALAFVSALPEQESIASARRTRQVGPRVARRRPAPDPKA